jgi:hypothetical protein
MKIMSKVYTTYIVELEEVEKQMLSKYIQNIPDYKNMPKQEQRFFQTLFEELNPPAQATKL